ncbi:uncharacterized protein LOC110716638 [Chenopodium quinoa]|uniref:Myb/SANT-like domain-containing protein n=1 Tax=Chenopodium quinoa TaxID=63459 RepID=A0A803MKH9_CHEQI|nr:uncharacterized protein LOC110716638 [Chenopodium quinoa]
MSTQRASFTSDVVTILLGILPDHVFSLAGGKTDWDVVARTLNTRTGKNFTSLSIMNWFTNMKNKHKAWNELKNWTGIGWSNGCPDVDVESEKWQAFVKRYRSIAKAFLKTPLENEEDWDKILISGYAKEVLSVEGSVEAESSWDPDNVHEIETRITWDIDACLDQLKRSSKPKNPFDEVLNILESMGIIAKYGEAFVVDILDSFRSIPGAIDLFTSLCSDVGRLHFLRKHCKLEDEVYKPNTLCTSLLVKGLYDN